MAVFCWARIDLSTLTKQHGTHLNSGDFWTKLKDRDRITDEKERDEGDEVLHLYYTLIPIWFEALSSNTILNKRIAVG